MKSVYETHKYFEAPLLFLSPVVPYVEQDKSHKRPQNLHFRYYNPFFHAEGSLTWEGSADINILEVLDRLPELDQCGYRFPYHHSTVFGPAGVKGEVVESGVVDSLPKQGPLQSTCDKLLLQQGHSDVKQTAQGDSGIISGRKYR